MLSAALIFFISPLVDAKTYDEFLQGYVINLDGDTEPVRLSREPVR
jgi:hypothetical protein